MVKSNVILALVAAAVLSVSANAGDLWKATDEPLGSWITVSFNDGGNPKALWCRTALCNDPKASTKGLSIPLYAFDAATDEKEGSSLVKVYQSAESAYMITYKIGSVYVEKGGRRVFEWPRFQRVTDPEGRKKMRVLPPKRD